MGHAQVSTLQRGRAIPTRIEQALMNELDRRNIPYQREYVIGKYHIDIALPGCKIAIEADGDYWHNLPGRKIHDARKNGYLKKQGWTVLRFSGTEIQASPSDCIEQVTRHGAFQSPQQSFRPTGR
jgi:very-short-patch-repair endonuclease